MSPRRPHRYRLAPGSVSRHRPWISPLGGSGSGSPGANLHSLSTYLGKYQVTVRLGACGRLLIASTKSETLALTPLHRLVTVCCRFRLQRLRHAALPGVGILAFFRIPGIPGRPVVPIRAPCEQGLKYVPAPTYGRRDPCQLVAQSMGPGQTMKAGKERLTDGVGVQLRVAARDGVYTRTGIVVPQLSLSKIRSWETKHFNLGATAVRVADEYSPTGWIYKKKVRADELKHNERRRRNVGPTSEKMVCKRNEFLLAAQDSATTPMDKGSGEVQQLTPRGCKAKPFPRN
ncbi:hypothetical protein B0H14DRAFT_3580986 [Mycena olivaceomarginata]|nr:hypothetical protein B0H14DRAFT_3580986 [Mycena olivaceomarginata]